jgi:hypothetical protein
VKTVANISPELGPALGTLKGHNTLPDLQHVLTSLQVNGVYVLSATDSGPALDPGNTDQVIRDEDAVTGGVTLKFTQKPKEDEEENN